VVVEVTLFDVGEESLGVERRVVVVIKSKLIRACAVLVLCVLCEEISGSRLAARYLQSSVGLSCWWFAC